MEPTHRPRPEDSRPEHRFRGNFMWSRFSLVTVALWLAAALCACDYANKFTATKIKDILDHPRDYENKEVTIYGTVTGSTSLLIVKFFEIEDESGRIRVVTERVLPQRGEKIRVTGRMESIELGADRVIVLREKREDEKEKSSRPGG